MTKTTNRYVITRDFTTRIGAIDQNEAYSARNWESALEIYKACLENMEDEMRTEISRHEISYQDIENEDVTYGYSLIREIGNDENDFTEDEIIDSNSLTYKHVYDQMERERAYQEEAEEE